VLHHIHTGGVKLVHVVFVKVFQLGVELELVRKLVIRELVKLVSKFIKPELVKLKRKLVI
jgi:hypothetical protein